MFLGEKLINYLKRNKTPGSCHDHNNDDNNSNNNNQQQRQQQQQQQ